jgi:capsular polysaccharide transport system permease protein
MRNNKNNPNSPDGSSATSADPSSETVDANTQELSVREKIDLIKKENLTGRQLRMARRLAQKNGLQFTSDLDAVRALRDAGIDPFQASNNMLKNVVGNNRANAMSNLPATVRRSSITDTIPLDDDQRRIEVNKIQKELVLRRRRRIAALVTKLVCFILIPTLLAGYYFYRAATPMYASFTEFVIQKADSPSAPAGASLFGSSLLATAQDSIAVQGYLSSREAMIRLDNDLGFKQVFQGSKVDALQRLADDVTNESAYKAYKKRVQIGYDPTEGIIKMEVVTPSPQISYAFSKALIGYAEQQVDQLTQRLREDQMKGAGNGYEKAEASYAKAQNNVVELQEKLGVLNPESEIAGQMSLIQQVESDLQQRELELIEMLDNPRPNQTKVTVLQNSIKSRKNLAKKLRNEMTINTNDVKSMSRITAELQAAQSQLFLRQELLAASLLQLETARVEANRQTRYLSMAVAPVAPDEASYPRSFENTILSALVFAGLFLMVSLTASILKEQVTG